MTIHTYGDESGHDGRNRFLVHGLLFVRHAAWLPLQEALTATLNASPFPDEMKWSSVSRATADRDSKAIDHFFSTFESNGRRSSPRFQALVIDQHRLDVKLFHDGNKDKCFYKLLYRLLVRRIVEVAHPQESIFVTLDFRNTRSYDLVEFRNILNNGIDLKFRGASPRVKSLEYAHSKNECLLQLADILTGAVGHSYNGHRGRPRSSVHKETLCAHIERKAGLKSLAVGDVRQLKFGLWPLKLS